MPKYICQICGVVSEQKSHHDSHLKRAKHKQAVKIFTLELEKFSGEERLEKYGKTDISEIVKDCATVIEKPKEVAFEKKTKTNTIIYENSEKTISKSISSESFKHKFLEFLGKMHNLLRGASVTGDQALDDILHSLCLCYLEDKISEEGQFDLANSEKSCYKGIKQRKVKDYVKYLKVSYLVDHPEELLLKDSTSSIQKCGKLLSKHPITSQIFKDNENFINCQDIQILCQLLKQCQEFSKNQNIFEEVDITGIAYEYMTTKHAGNGGTSKEMGQYFTERPLMAMCFQMIDKSDIEELGIDDNSTLGDEFCATLGFPLMAREFLKGYNINIQDKNIYGVEWHERLSKFAYMNAMFSMNNFDNVKRGNSFITNVTPHLDISVHNVPFGKSMTPKMIEKGYQAFLSENPDKGYPDFKDYVPFNSKKIDAILASQVVLYKTKKMGLMIIKDGEETSGKSNDKYRKWFSENCIIKKIMKIPSGAFTCTGTKTVCIYFIKKEGHMTENIQFLQLSDDGNKITEICHVSMADMKQNHYSWDPNSYIVDEEMEKMMSNSKCEWKKLGEVCEMLPTTKHYTKIGKNTGKYRFYNSSQKDKLYLDTSEVDRDSIIIGNGGELCVHFDKKFTASKHVTVIHINDIDKMNIKYIYYFILWNIENIKKQTTGGGIQWLNKEKINNINIPIPSIETQNQVVQILDDLTEQKQLLSDRKSGIERQMKYYFEKQIKKHNSSKTLNQFGEVCHTKGAKQLSKKNFVEGEYFVIGGGQTPTGKHNAFNKEANTILCSQSGSYSGFISRYNTPIWASDCFSIHSKNKEIMNENYLYYYLKMALQENIYKLQKGAGQPHVYSNDMTQLLLVIPNMIIQTEIVQYLDKLEAKKNCIDEEISEIDTLMKQILEQSYN